SVALKPLEVRLPVCRPSTNDHFWRSAGDSHFPLLTLGKSQAAFPADEEEIAPLEEFERDVGERLRPLGADRAPRVIDEREVAIGQQRAIAIAGIGPVLR